MTSINEVVPVSHRGYFDYHFISLEPMEDREKSIRVWDQQVTRNVWGEDEEGQAVITGTVPNWKSVWDRAPVTQYVICDGEGGIVKRIPVKGSRRRQMELASRHLAAYRAART